MNVSIMDLLNMPIWQLALYLVGFCFAVLVLIVFAGNSQDIH